MRCFLYQEMSVFNLFAPIANKQPPTIDKITKTNGLDASIATNASPPRFVINV